MSKVLIICPSIRTERFKTFYKSLRETTDCDLIVKSKQGSITQFINEAVQDFSYDYYHLTNDDFVYQTPGWVEIMVDKLRQNNDWGVAYGNDLLMSERLCTAPFISKKMIENVGWLQMPRLQHLYNDVIWRYIGLKINKLFYFKDIIIEHCHYMNNKAVIDDCYKNTNSQSMYKNDQNEFNKWIANDSDELIKNIQEKIDEK